MPDPTPAERDAAQQFAAQNIQLNLKPLQDAITSTYGDSYLAGAYAGAQQAGATIVAGLPGVETPTDWTAFWNNWTPGNTPAGDLLAADGGLRDLMNGASVAISNIGDTTVDRIGSILADGVTNGASVDEIADRLHNFITSPERAFKIADTEIARAVSVASLNQYQAQNVAELDWLISPDACDECQSYAEGGPYSLQDAPDLPAHPYCRCSYAPRDPGLGAASAMSFGAPTDLESIAEAAAQAAGDALPTVAEDLTVDAGERAAADIGEDLVGDEGRASAEQSLTDDQLQALTPGRRTEASITKELTATPQGQNVLDVIKGFTEKRGGVARARAQVEDVLNGDASEAVTTKVNDFLSAMNTYPTDQVPQLFRGMGIKVPKDAGNAWWDEFEAQYQVGKEVNLNVSSFTSSEKKAKEFQYTLGGTRPIAGSHLQMRVVIDGDVHALPVENLSKFKSEKEWLSGGKFTVTGFDAPAGKETAYVIHMVQSASLDVERAAAKDVVSAIADRDLAAATEQDLYSLLTKAGETGTDDDLKAITDELDRRDALERQATDTASPDLEAADPDMAAKDAAYDAAIEAGQDPELAYADVYGAPVAAVRTSDAISMLRGNGYTGVNFDQLSRAAYRDQVQRLYVDAEDATRGAMLNPAGIKAGIDPLALMSGSEATARKYASEELLDYWEANGRLTLDNYRAGLLGGPIKTAAYFR